MGIYNALFTGSSGLSAFGEAVRVIGDNIANVNSLGFKAQNVVFSDVLSQTVGVTRSNIANQVGNGVRIGQITRDNSQGSIQNTSNPTDMAINGRGLFALRNTASNETFYSRAGAFFLDKDSNLIDGQGFVVQGWATNTAGAAVGNVTDITFGNLAAQAQATTVINPGVTLDSNALPFAAGNAFDPNNAGTYHYKSEVNVFDSLGQTHAVTLYFTKTAANSWQWQAGVDGADVVGGIPGEPVIIGNAASNFNVTNADPAAVTTAGGVAATVGAVTDNATQVATVAGASAFSAPSTATFTVTSTDGAGGYTVTNDVAVYNPATGAVLLAAGTVSTGAAFTAATGLTVTIGTNAAAAGETSTFSTATLGSTTTASPPATGAAGVGAFPNGTQISAATTFSSNVYINGTLVSAGTSVGAALGGSVTVQNSEIPAGTTLTAGNMITNPAANQLVFGTNGELVTEVGPGIIFPWNSAAASTIGFDFGQATTTDQQGVTGVGLNGTVQLAGSFATRQMTRDGFTSGFLDKLETDSTGRIFGVFTNGQRRSLYQVALANFPNSSTLTSVGNNLKQETISSGTPVLEKPGNGGMGSITPYGLEQSNVDLAGEFVKLIVVQRGYEANSKTIMTTDQMLSSLMQIKR